MNAEYIRKLSPEDYIRHASPYLEAAGVGHMDKAIFARILQPRTEVFTDITGMVDFLAKLDENYGIDLFTNKKSPMQATFSPVTGTLLSLEPINAAE